MAHPSFMADFPALQTVVNDAYNFPEVMPTYSWQTNLQRFQSWFGPDRVKMMMDEIERLNKELEITRAQLERALDALGPKT